MNDEELEKLIEKAKILYWKGNDKIIFQQNHIGKLNKIKKLENTQKSPELKLIQEG